MRNICIAILTLILISCNSTQIVKLNEGYESDFVKLKGILDKSKYQHPNGMWLTAYTLNFDEEITIVDGDFRKNIQRIQVVQDDTTVLENLLGKEVEFYNKVYRGWNAWYLTDYAINPKP